MGETPYTIDYSSAAIPPPVRQLKPPAVYDGACYTLSYGSGPAAIRGSGKTPEEAMADFVSDYVAKRDGTVALFNEKKFAYQ